MKRLHTILVFIFLLATILHEASAQEAVTVQGRSVEEEISVQELADRLVDYAATFLGTPYRYGANGPKRFDCTAYTRYVYGHFGITSLSRSSKDQARDGRQVDISDFRNLQKGDILLLGSRRNPKVVGHVGIFIGLWLYHAYVMPRPAADVQRHATKGEVVRGIWTMLVAFFTKLPLRQTCCTILFLLFYRFPEALLTKMSVTFLMRPNSAGGLGLSPQEFGLASGTVGVIGLTLGGILGGIAASRDGLKRWLWPMVMAITLPDLVYVYLSYAMPTDLLVINVCVFIEQFGYGFGFSAYMLYLIYYSMGEHKTSHYALCTAFMALSMMIPGLFAGALQEAVGYQAFFLIVVAACSLTYIVTAFLKIDPEFGKKKAEA